MLDEIVELFRLADVTPSPAFFDVKKLQHFNAEYIRALDVATFVERARPHFEHGDATLAVLEPVAERARAAGLVTRFGRKVLELRPPLETNKGTAVTHLLRSHGVTRALYAGDDTTDLDAFRALEGLELGVRVAVASAEGPPELRGAADVVVEGPAGMLELLRSL